MKKLLSININYSTRKYGLDLYRATAIILVVLTHGNLLLGNTFLDGFPWIRLIDGVDLFFVLSGFLIGSILLKILNNSTKFNLNDIFHFWKRRWFRTLPMYYLFLFINYLLVNHKIINGDINQFKFKFLFFCQNFATPFYDFFWESWSLSVEEWFYLLLPLIILLFSFAFRNKKAFLISCLILIVAPLLYRIYISPMKVDGFWWDVTFRKTVLTRLDTIGYGVFASWVKFYYESFWIKNKNISFILGLLILFIAPNIHAEPCGFYVKTFGLNILPLGAMLLLPKSESVKSFKTKFGKVVTHISVISYAMYLVNLALIAMVILKQFPPEGGIDSIAKYIIFWSLVILTSTLLYKIFEKPIMDLREKSFKKNNM